MVVIDEVESHLGSIELFINDLKNKHDSKQSERVLSNNIWMSDMMDRTINKNIIPLSSSIKDLRVEYEKRIGSASQFDFALKHCTEVHKLMSNLHSSYKQGLGVLDIKLKLHYTLPELSSNLNSLRNRVNILKGNIARIKSLEDEDRRLFFK